MIEPTLLGQHRILREGDTVHCRLVGRMDLPELVAFHAVLAEVLAEQRRCYILGDVSALGSVDADARHYTSNWHDTHVLTGIALQGASFATRALVNLLLGAIRLLTGRTLDVAFVATEAEGRRWISAHRTRLAAPPGTA